MLTLLLFVVGVLAAGAPALAVLRRGEWTWAGQLAIIAGAGMLLLSTLYYLELLVFGRVWGGTLLLAALAGGAALFMVRDRMTWTRPTWPKQPAALAIGLVVLLCVILLASNAALFPFTSWDGRFIWNYKAMVLFHEGTVFSDSFLHPHRVHFHRDYPLLVPFMEYTLYTIQGVVDERLARLFFVAQFAALLLLLGDAVRREAGTVTAAVCVLLLAAAGFREDFADYDGTTVTSGVADFPFAFFMLIAVVGLWSWQRGGGTAAPWLVALGIGGALQTKLEGVAGFFAIAIAAAGSLVVVRTDWRPRARSLALPMAAGLLLGVPYFVLKAQLPNFYDEKYSQALTLEFLPRAIERLPLVLSWMMEEVVKAERWNFVWLLWPVALAASAWRRGSRATLLLDGLLLCWLGLYVVVYCFSPLHLGYHLQTSVSRLLSHLLPVLLFRLALAAGEFSGDCFARPAADHSSS